MASYLSIDILEEHLRFVEEDSRYEDAVKAMTPGILTYYFTPTAGFLVAPEQNRNDNYADFIIIRIQRRFRGDRGLVDHCVVEAKKESDNVDAAMDQLVNALDHANTQYGRCWAMLVVGPRFHFFEYHCNLPTNHRLLPCFPPGESTNEFHARHASGAIDAMLRHMQQHHTPPAR